MYLKCVCRTILVVVLFSSVTFAREFDDVVKRINEVNKKIKSFESQLAEGGETRLLEDLLFSLSESYLQKSFLLYGKKKLKNPNVPDSELDFSKEDREKLKSIEILEQIVKLFPKKRGVTDRALYSIAMTHKSLGEIKKSIVSFKMIINDFKQSQYASRSYSEIGDFYSQKNDHEFALDFYKKGLDRNNKESYYKLKDKIGWTYIHLGKDLKAYALFLSALKEFKSERGVDPHSEAAGKLLQSLARSYSDLSLKERKSLVHADLPFHALLRELSPGLLYYSKALKTAAKRLSIKKRFLESAQVGVHWLATEQNMRDRIEAVYLTYKSWKKSKRNIYLENFVQEITSTLSFLRPQDLKKKGYYKKTRVDFELISRDYLTKLDKKYRKTKKEVILSNLIDGYKSYIELFRKSKRVKELSLNRAELLFAQNQYVEAGQTYFTIARMEKSKKSRLQMLDAAVKSFITSLSQEDLSTQLKRLEARAGLRRVGMAYLRLAPKGPTAETVAFNYSQSFYRERNFKKAIKSFMYFLKRFPKAKQAPQVALLILDSYDQMNDKKGLVAIGKKMLAANMILDSNARSQVKEVVEESIISGSREGVLGRNNSLLKLAAKYRGTSLGDKALYEAFVDFKAKRDPQLYIVGEQLLSQHKNSKFAKTVVAEMGKIAIITADIRKAALYFQLFSEKFPTHKDAKGLAQTAAEIYRNLHDFKSARNVYLGINDYALAAEMDLLRGNWASLKKICTKVNAKSKEYYCGIADYFLGNFQDSRSSLSRSVNIGNRGKSASALYFLTLIKYQTYENLKMQSGREVETIHQKQGSLVELQALNDRLSQTSHPQWGLAGQFLMGRAHSNFNSFILSTPIPDRMPASVSASMKKQLQAQASPYKKSSREFFNSCLHNAEKYKIFNGAALGCSRKTSNFDEKLLITLKSGGRSGDNNKIKKIRNKLYSKPRDIKTYINLANSLLMTGAAGEAAAVLSRALEIQSKNQTVLSLMGVAQLLLGNDQLAYEHFSKSRKMNSREPNAVAGETFLYQKYGYRKSYQRISSIYKATRRNARYDLSFYK